MYHNYLLDEISEALPLLMKDLLRKGDETGSRNGACKELTHVGTTLLRPWRREILVPERKANIAAQIAETMWVLAGRNDIKFLSHYLPRAAEFSDDGETWRGGYGPRLRKWDTGDDHAMMGVEVDQLAEVVRILRADPLSRRAVMSIFDPAVDFGESKDIPCNNWITFSSRLGHLDMHVGIRSNDLMWGWSGINAFEWSALQEIVAGLLGIEVGALHFSTTSLHLYAPYWAKGQRIADGGEFDHRVLEHPNHDSPRFALPEDRGSIEDLDALIKHWFILEEKIRTNNGRYGGKGWEAQIDVFPEPMMQSWLRVIQWWWTADHAALKPLAGTRLEYATHVAMQPTHVADRKGELETKVCGTAVHGAHIVQTGPDAPFKCPGLKAAVSNSDVVNGESDFLRYAIATHNEKHVAYGDSWKRRGEMLGIMANIARKVDRLGGAETADETSADTAMDLMIYLAKYRSWIFDQHRRGRTDRSDRTDFPNNLLRVMERETAYDQACSVEAFNEELRRGFDLLEKAVEEKRTQDRAVTVDLMLKNAYLLARYLWETSQHVDPIHGPAYDDDYRGADVD